MNRKMINVNSDTYEKILKQKHGQSFDSILSDWAEQSKYDLDNVDIQNAIYGGDLTIDNMCDYNIEMNMPSGTFNEMLSKEIYEMLYKNDSDLFMENHRKAELILYHNRHTISKFVFTMMQGFISHYFNVIAAPSMKKERRNDYKTYLLYSEKANLYKIGRATSVQCRLDQINSTAPIDAVIVCVIDLDIERELHREFKHLREEKGEWFSLLKKDVDYICDIKIRVAELLEKYSKDNGMRYKEVYQAIKKELLKDNK